MTTSLVIAIEPDRDQAARLSAIVGGRLGAELLLADSVARALTALGDRVPDLILTPALLSTRDEAALSARLRELGAAAAHVQTVTVPRIGGVAAGTEEGGIFKRFRRPRPAAAAADGCDPDVFAQQVAEYLQRARAERPAVSAPAIDLTAIDAPVVAQEAIAESMAEEAMAEELISLPAVVEPAVAPMPVEAMVPTPAFAEVIAAAPLIVDEVVTPPVTDGPEIAAAPVLEVEETAVAPVLLEEPVTLPVIVEVFVPAAAPLEAIEPPAIAPEVAAPVAAAPAVDEPQFSVDDLALTIWVADEPDTAPLEAAVVPPAAPADDDRFDIAAQDFGDVDISTLLEGLVLPDAPAAGTEAPRAPSLVPPSAPKPEPEPESEAVLAPLPSRRKLPPPRPMPEPKAPRRRVKPPVQDEWGLFDPEQCGFAALLAKLDAVTEDEEMSKRRGTQTRLVSYN